jgi:hypothetical protein
MLPLIRNVRRDAMDPHALIGPIVPLALLLERRCNAENDRIIGIGTADAGHRLLTPGEPSIEAQRSDKRKDCIERPRAHALRT